MSNLTFTADPALEEELGGEEVEAEAENELFLGDGTCWIADPEYLGPASGAAGVLAIQYRDGDLFTLYSEDGESRVWVNAEIKPEAKPKTRGLKSVN